MDGTGKSVRISGYELWQFDNDGLIENSKGHFDSAEYERQLRTESLIPGSARVSHVGFGVSPKQSLIALPIIR